MDLSVRRDEPCGRAPVRFARHVHQLDEEGQPASREDERPRRAKVETRIPARSARTFHLLLPDRPWVKRVRVTLTSQFDFEPIAVAEAAVE